MQRALESLSIRLLARRHQTLTWASGLRRKIQSKKQPLSPEKKSHNTAIFQYPDRKKNQNQSAFGHAESERALLFCASPSGGHRRCRRGRSGYRSESHVTRTAHYSVWCGMLEQRCETWHLGRRGTQWSHHAIDPYCCRTHLVCFRPRRRHCVNSPNLYNIATHAPRWQVVPLARSAYISEPESCFLGALGSQIRWCLVLFIQISVIIDRLTPKGHKMMLIYAIYLLNFYHLASKSKGNLRDLWSKNSLVQFNLQKKTNTLEWL